MVSVSVNVHYEVREALYVYNFGTDDLNERFEQFKLFERQIGIMILTTVLSLIYCTNCQY